MWGEGDIDGGGDGLDELGERDDGVGDMDEAGGGMGGVGGEVVEELEHEVVADIVAGISVRFGGDVLLVDGGGDFVDGEGGEVRGGGGGEDRDFGGVVITGAEIQGDAFDADFGGVGGESERDDGDGVEFFDGGDGGIAVGAEGDGEDERMDAGAGDDAVVQRLGNELGGVFGVREKRDEAGEQERVHTETRGFSASA